MRLSNLSGSLPYSLLILGFIVLCSADNEAREPKELFSQASCDFGVDLLKVQLKGNEGNVVFSPSSVGVLLAIVQQGAKENTLKQLDSVLRMTAEESRNGHGAVLKSLQREKNNVTVEWGNRAYMKPGFQLSDGYNSTIQESFGADIQELNFVEPSPQEAADAMNGWVKEVTHDNIKDLVSPSVLTPDTSLVLLNAIYFKGRWDVPFKKILTKEDDFDPRAENPVKVPFMSQEDRFIAGEDPESGVKWVDLPYKDEQFSMLFILPIEKHGLEKVLEKMSGSLLNKIIRDEKTRQVQMSIPKFKLQEKVMLVKALQELGLTDIFTSESNLEGITPNVKYLAVSRMVHEASVEVDEDGSTASAASSGFFNEFLSFPKGSDFLHFRADHPFLFFILDRTNKVPLFAGRVSDPSSGAPPLPVSPAP